MKSCKIIHKAELLKTGLAWYYELLVKLDH